MTCLHEYFRHTHKFTSLESDSVIWTKWNWDRRKGNKWSMRSLKTCCNVKTQHHKSNQPGNMSSLGWVVPPNLFFTTTVPIILIGQWQMKFHDANQGTLKNHV